MMTILQCQTCKTPIAINSNEIKYKKELNQNKHIVLWEWIDFETKENVFSTYCSRCKNISYHTKEGLVEMEETK